VDFVGLFNLGSCYKHTIMVDITQCRDYESCTYTLAFDPKLYTDKDLESLLEDSNLSETTWKKIPLKKGRM
jgi:hypothetical protein